MCDITKCSGDNCILKENCKRYKNESGFLQNYFIDVPFTIVDGNVICDFYLEDKILKSKTSKKS